MDMKEIVPIGGFILAQKDIEPVMGTDGSYYHYRQVCTLVKRMRDMVEQAWDAAREKHQPFGPGSTHLYKYNSFEQWLKEQTNEH